MTILRPQLKITVAVILAFGSQVCMSFHNGLHLKGKPYLVTF